MGQSNMVGFFGPIDSTGIDATNARIHQWGRTGGDDGKVILASDPLQHVTINSTTIGMGLTVGKNQLNVIGTQRDILLVPVAKNNTGFNSTDWNPGNVLYEAALARVNAAMASRANNKLTAILWHQGERDSTSTQTVYATALDAMISDIRSRMTGASAAPFVCGQTLIGGTQTSTAITAALTDTPNRESFTAFVSSTGLTSGGDNLHFSATSLRTLGDRYFNAINDAKANT